MKNFKIKGRRWNLEKGFYPWDAEQRFPHYEPIPNSEQEFQVEAESLNHAHLWLITNHPELAVGACVVGVDNDDFLLDAVLDYYVACLGTENYQTILEYIRNMAEKAISNEEVIV